MQTVTSKDGTRIAYEKSGQGPAVILVSGATMTHFGFTDLAQLLAQHFTVYNYDRRGRGASSDARISSVENEIEDIAALIEESGGAAYIFGVSSGACLAMLAAAHLGDRVLKLAMYEAPYDESAGAAELWRQYRTHLDSAIAGGNRSAAVELFVKFVGANDEMVSQLKNTPTWQELEAVAPTLRYDAAAMGKDRAVPIESAAKITAETLVLDGGASLQIMPFMSASAKTLAEAIPNSHRRTIEGQAHDFSPEIMAPILTEYFLSE